MSRPPTSLSIDALEEQIIDALRPQLPAGWQLLLLSCELSDGPTNPEASCASVYLTDDEAGVWAAGNLPALSPGLKKQFIGLREALFRVLGTRWSNVELEFANDDNGYLFSYDYAPPARLSGRTDWEAAGRFEAPAFLARCLAARADLAEAPDDDGADDYAAEAPPRNPAPAARPAAPAEVAWVCTWCHDTYRSARQPTAFQPGKCPRNPGKSHAWHRQ